MSTLTLTGLIGAADGITTSFLTQTYPAIASAISPAITYAAILYWALLGYKVYAGNSPLEWRDVLTKAVMTSAVFGTLNWGGLALTIYNIFVSFMESAAGTIMAGQPTANMLDALYTNADKVSETLRGVDWYQVNAILEGMGILIVNTILFGVALVYMTIAKFGLAITMVLLPLFIGFAMFSQTRQWFMNWLSMMFNFSLVYILVIAIVRFGFLAFGDYIDEVGKAAGFIDARLITGEQVSYLLIIEAVLIIFMLQIKGWAAALSGGATVGGASLLMMAVRTLTTKGAK
ncbi:Inner membrane protein of type IV secretion of T-DNA complex, VirB6 (plasmid) [Collimonas arenae]|uniref:Inner membrane protein of type IV secretion of T-DNA complex, VirB6 n=1 Tax=Collimonas arenae TaxID=279058 RepID=A0A0A1FKI8_9BURK|nr:type IV secretion system protein [Collimonas arenae]AIY44194.1 Inner membrane protein of type IV secretion of T-DNA complex, VirB6 [Collimonas arenae]